jgi:response regulator RpfG family c-di-GMP phosphodiesterase
MAKLLLVTNDDELAAAYGLRLASHAVTRTGHGHHSLQHALELQPDLIIIDITAESGAYDLIDLVRDTPETSHAHIVVLMPLIDPATRQLLADRGVQHTAVRSHATVGDVVAKIDSLSI